VNEKGLKEWLRWRTMDCGTEQVEKVKSIRIRIRE
jgi:hypothetical protein